MARTWDLPLSLTSNWGGFLPLDAMLLTYQTGMAMPRSSLPGNAGWHDHFRQLDRTGSHPLPDGPGRFKVQISSVQGYFGLPSRSTAPTVDRLTLQSWGLIPVQ